MPVGYFEDYTGTRIGNLVAENKVGQTKYQVWIWRWRCDCGNTRDAVPSSLRELQTRKRGPMTCLKCNLEKQAIRKPLVVPGQKFSLWTVKQHVQTNGKRNAWLCRCKCKAEGIVNEQSLIHGKSVSCPKCLPATATDGERLRAWRLCSGLTGGECAQRAGINRARWFQLEVQERISPENYARLTNVSEKPAS